MTTIATRTRVVSAALLSACILDACGKQTVGSTACTKTGAQTLLGGGGFSLTEVPPASSLDPLPAKASVTDPKLLGGVIQMKSVDRAKQTNVAVDAFSAIAFPMKSNCSAVLEVRKENGAYKIDAFTASSCLIERLLFQGSAPSIAFFRPQTDALLDGYESIPVTLKELDQRDALLAKLDAIPNATVAARKSFLVWGINTERVAGARYSSSLGDATLAPDLCLKIPEAESAAWSMLSDADKAKVSDPVLSDRPRPAGCQLLVDGQWYTFDVPAAAAAEKKALLDDLVLATERYHAFQAKRAGIAAEVANAMESIRALGEEVYRLDQKSRHLRMSVFAMGAAESNTTLEGRSLAGANKDAYVELAKTMFTPEHAAEIEASKALAYSAASRQPMKDRYLASLTASDAKAFEYLKALRTVQAAMKAKPERVGIATNQIAHWDGSKVSPTGKQFIVLFKDLGIRPADLKVPEELSRHTFDFSNAFLKMSFDVSKKHPTVNNLRHELNDGYALTFAGLPVGAMRSETDESGGASVINLPARSKNTSGSSGSGEASNERDNKRQTTDGGC